MDINTLSDFILLIFFFLPAHGPWPHSGNFPCDSGPQAMGRGSLLWQSSLQWAVPARAPSFCSSCSARLWGPTDSVWGTFKDQMRGQDPGRDCLSSEELADLGGGWPMPQGRQRWGLRVGCRPSRQLSPMRAHVYQLLLSTQRLVSGDAQSLTPLKPQHPSCARAGAF